MNIIDISLLNVESFVEEDVVSMTVNIINKIIVIKTNGGMLITGNYLENLTMKISNWDSVAVHIHNELKKKYEAIEIDEKAYLTKIIRYNVNTNSIKLCGYGKSIGWVEWEFIKPQVEVYSE